MSIGYQIHCRGVGGNLFGVLAAGDHIADYTDAELGSA
jgi:hypothetical protein